MRVFEKLREIPFNLQLPLLKFHRFLNTDLLPVLKRETFDIRKLYRNLNLIIHGPGGI